MKAHCENCDWSGDSETLGRQLVEIPHLGMRLDPGGVVPVGECPICSAFAYLDAEPLAHHTQSACRG